MARNVPTTFQADIPAYLPESIVKVADEEGWVIMLHMVKSRGVADLGNIHWIRRYCESYPNMQLILAHSARGFQPSHNFEGLEQLRGLDNLWCVTSANCEPMAHVAIIRILGHDKLLYGGDLPATHQRAGPSRQRIRSYGSTAIRPSGKKNTRPSGRFSPDSNICAASSGCAGHKGSVTARSRTSSGTMRRGCLA